MEPNIIQGNLVDVDRKMIYPIVMNTGNEKVVSIEKKSDAIDADLPYILPGFIDSHVHIESSMLVPSEFARLAVVHGTVGTVSDPHEIANVCGVNGVLFMINNGSTVPFKFNFGAPSCVPATAFETAGATLDSGDVQTLLDRNDIRYLSEMMNFPGVLNNDGEVMKKIKAAQAAGKPVDGHAPGLRGNDAKNYAAAGIATDHECFTIEEAREKLGYGMKILIREGSAAKNFDALIDLLHEFPERIMFCSDDKHPDSLVEGHINRLCVRAVARGIDIFKVLQAACVNPVEHYKLDVGLLKEGDPADFIIVRDLKEFEVMQTYINGQEVAANGKAHFFSDSDAGQQLNNFHCSRRSPKDFYLNVTTASHEVKYPVIEAYDGQLITGKGLAKCSAGEGRILPDIKNDILFIAVVNRYQDAPVAVSLIKNFGLKRGAIASSVAHDSHNIVIVGTDEESMCRAANLVITYEGGISCVDGQKEVILPLPVAGLMSCDDGYEVAKNYTAIDAMAKSLGSNLSAPFMTLSFMSLLVIPHLKLSDLGLFDGDEFKLSAISNEL